MAAVPPGPPPGGLPSPPPPPPDDRDDDEEFESRKRRAEVLRGQHLSSTDPQERLKKLKELYEADLINEEEYKAKRIEILADI